MIDPRAMALAGLVTWLARPRPAPRRVAAAAAAARRRRPSTRNLRRAGLAAAVLAAGMVSPVAAILVVVVAAVRSQGHDARALRAWQAEVERTLPDALDLLALVVSAGVPAHRALAMAGLRCPAPHRRAWAQVTARIDAGQAFADAVPRLLVLLGPPVRPLVTALLAAEHDGVALGPALDRCSQEAHRRRRVRAEEAARRVPVLMLFPLVCCVLPAFGLLTVVPLLVGSVADLSLPG